jgi:hypothetical protein
MISCGSEEAADQTEGKFRAQRSGHQADSNTNLQVTPPEELFLTLQAV